MSNIGDLYSLPNEPVIVWRWPALWDDFQADYDADLRVGVQLLDAVQQPHYVIIDTTAREANASIDNMVYGMNKVFRGQNSIGKHPNIRHIYAVGTSNLVWMVSKGLNSATFGYAKVNVYRTLDDALSTIREQITLEQ